MSLDRLVWDRVGGERVTVSDFKLLKSKLHGAGSVSDTGPNTDTASDGGSKSSISAGAEGRTASPLSVSTAALS